MAAECTSSSHGSSRHSAGGAVQRMIALDRALGIGIRKGMDEAAAVLVGMAVDQYDVAHAEKLSVLAECSDT